MLDGAPRIRWDVSGDNLLPNGHVDVRYVRAKYSWHERNPDGISLGYTHAARRMARAGFGPETHPSGFNLIASCDHPEDAKSLRAEGWRTARVAKSKHEPLDSCERLCPYDLQRHQGQTPTTNCAKCGLCWPKKHQDKSIVFIQF